MRHDADAAELRDRTRRPTRIDVGRQPCSGDRVMHVGLVKQRDQNVEI